ncbi:flagellar hook-associated protein FlgK [Cryobacterium sinapicolor]|uniref:Flagellar hook-associated protein 1 n=1 Tax=Cryobacterium sinapicolor TaxID=1259236 RepID=A0ABY2J407_9MICO|nr:MULTISPECIES: flagellar hook-associated protein FlgK [Cryobacterium]TFC92976.1 flagellar hook-associated protein FlgK [Cryobacterium sp. TMT3-29-2]TFC98610.1 flagellar hook-associated protein FlgK [Cryobacterium sinapicolor]
MSTFGGLNTAYTGLVAARQGLDVVGQNIANANTEGYTRQRVTTSAVDAADRVGLMNSGVLPGQGVSVDGIARLGSASLDAQVRATAAVAGYSAVRANALGAVEASMQEPGENGLSAQLQEFWAGWGDVANAAGETAPTGVLLAQAGAVTTQISRGYQAVSTQWSSERESVDTLVAEINGAAGQVAELNARIRQSVAGGGNANELIDRRSRLTTTLAALTGGTLVDRTDGTVDVLLGGNALVTGDTARPLVALGARTLDGPNGLTSPAGATNPVRVEWADRAGAIPVDGGELAGALSLLTRADASGTGGALAEAAVAYNSFATNLAATVNGIYSTGDNSTLPGAFFGSTGTGPAALGLFVRPSTAAELTTGLAANGALDGSIADRIAQLGAGTAVDGAGNPVRSPSIDWSNVVTSLAVTTKNELRQASLADLTSRAAVNAQLSNSSVDLDEENVNLLMFQHAYQGAARVLTAVDEMLDTLINRTGLVGR